MDDGTRVSLQRGPDIVNKVNNVHKQDSEEFMRFSAIQHPEWSCANFIV